MGSMLEVVTRLLNTGLRVRNILELNKQLDERGFPKHDDALPRLSAAQGEVLDGYDKLQKSRESAGLRKLSSIGAAAALSSIFKRKELADQKAKRAEQRKEKARLRYVLKQEQKRADALAAMSPTQRAAYLAGPVHPSSLKGSARGAKPAASPSNN